MSVSDRRFLSGLKRRAAATSPARIRIHDLKACSTKAIAKIERRAAQISGALVVDEKFNAIPLDDFVACLLFVERHFIVQPRATAFANLDAQTFPRVLLLRIEQVAQLARCVLGDVYHSRANYVLPHLKSKTGWAEELRSEVVEESLGVEMLRC